MYFNFCQLFVSINFVWFEQQSKPKVYENKIGQFEMNFLKKTNRRNKIELKLKRN